MSKKTTSTSDNSLKYDPASMNRYQQLQGGASKVMQGYIDNPLSNPTYQLGSQFAQRAASQGGQNNINALMQMMRTSGFGGASGTGFQAAQQGRIGRANQSMMSQANLGNIMQAFQRQLGAAGQGLAYNPLMTGTSGNSTQTTSGLGTWLPQLAGTALGAGMGAMTGGASMAFPGMTGGQISGAFGGPTQAMPQMSNLNNQWLGGGGGGNSFFNPLSLSQMGPQ